MRGARVNVIGTVCVFEAAKRRELGTPIAYASSAAVYDRSGAMSPTHDLRRVQGGERGHGAHLLGGVRRSPSVGLRPFCVYGPGRDQGLTAEPTHAMHAAAHGEPYAISFGGTHRAALRAGRGAGARLALRASPADSAEVYDMPGEPVHMSDVVSAIKAAAPDADVTHGDEPLPFPDELPGPRFDAR